MYPYYGQILNVLHIPLLNNVDHGICPLCHTPLWLNKTIYDHAGMERSVLAPGGPDTYRETCYTRVDSSKAFRLRGKESVFDHKI